MALEPCSHSHLDLTKLLIQDVSHSDRDMPAGPEGQDVGAAQLQAGRAQRVSQAPAMKAGAGRRPNTGTQKPGRLGACFGPCGEWEQCLDPKAAQGEAGENKTHASPRGHQMGVSNCSQSPREQDREQEQEQQQGAD